MARKLVYIDLFAGAGGLSEGFTRAGFTPLCHIERDRFAAETLKTRVAYHHLKANGKINLYKKYLRGDIDQATFYKLIPRRVLKTVIHLEISNDNLQYIFSRIESGLKAVRKSKVDLIVGGPPCQAYSIAGRSADEDRMRNDERNFLYKMYAKFLKKYQPKYFVFENVPGLFSANNGVYYKNLTKYFKRIGYELTPSILDASEFGVVQNRKRVIIIGRRKHLKKDVLNFRKVKNRWCVNDVFYDLPAVVPGSDSRINRYCAPKNYYLKKFGIRNGMGFVTQHIARPHNVKDLKIYKMAIRACESGKLFRNNQIPEKDRTQKNITSFLDRFKALNRNKKAHTMLAHIAKDGHYYIHPDIKQLRSITVREAARIQSFPDDYFFEGPRTPVFKQIGNAVPPLMAYSIAKTLRGRLNVKK